MNNQGTLHKGKINHTELVLLAIVSEVIGQCQGELLKIMENRNEKVVVK